MNWQMESWVCENAVSTHYAPPPYTANYAYAFNHTMKP